MEVKILTEFFMFLSEITSKFNFPKVEL